MKTTHTKRFLSVVFCGAMMATFLPSLSAQSAKEGDVAIVVNANTPVSNLTLAEVRKIFRGDKQYWSTDLPVVLLVRALVTATDSSPSFGKLVSVEPATRAASWSRAKASPASLP